MQFHKKKWKKALFFLVILAIVLGFLTNFFFKQHLYWVTGYIFIVSVLVVFVQKHYPNKTYEVDIPKIKLAHSDRAPLKMSDILLQEFAYIKDTASQAMNDRHTMVNYFLLSAGVVVTGIGVLLSKEGAVDFRYRDETVLALSLLFCTVGWIYFLQLVRLRQAWCDSARAMNHIKQVFVQYSGNKPERARGAFLWNITTIPKANQKMTVFYLSALLISVLSAVAIVLASLILFGEKCAAKFWFVPIGLGFYHLFFQMFQYTALLEEPAPTPVPNQQDHPNQMVK